jgi:hypothetical protein
MSETATAAAKNQAGEEVTIEIPIPNATRADEWNTAIRDGYKKAGVEVPGAEPVAAAVTAPGEKKDPDTPTIYETTITINGKEMTFRDADAANVLKQVTAAVEAAQLSAAPAAKVDEKKPEQLTAADMFDVGTKLIAGDASGLDTLLEKSGVFDRWLEKQGVSIEQIKAATTAVQTNSVHDAWKTATDQFTEKVKAGEIDFPGGPQNMKMMGITLAQLGLKPSVESMEKAWAHMKKEGLVFSVEPAKAGEKKDPPATEKKKDPPGSTAVGAAAAGGTPGGEKPVIDPNRKVEIDLSQLSPRQYTESYNNLILQGWKPEQIVVKQ